MSLLQILELTFDELIKTNQAEYICKCPFHEDDKPSLSINVTKKLFHCHACNTSGDMVKLLAKKLPYDKELIRYELNWLAVELKWTLPNVDVDAWHNRLLSNKDKMGYLAEKRRWTVETIKELCVGFDGDRITIPITNIFGQVVNVRRYLPGAKDNEYKVLNIKGYGKARLYGIGRLRTDRGDILICEGEPDTIAATSSGLNAVTSTAGARSFDQCWGQFFRGKSAYIVYDNDTPGKEGAARTANVLLRHACNTKVISLPSGGKDLTDYYLSGKSRDDLEQIIAETEYLKVADTSTDAEDDGNIEIHDTELSEASEERFYKKFVRMRVMVSGKTLIPYLVPKVVSLSCTLPGMAICKQCHLNFIGGKKELTFNHHNEVTLQLVETTADNHIRIFKDSAGIPGKCKVVTVNVLEAQNIEEVKVIPVLDFSSDDSQYVIRQVYYIGHGLNPNASYEIIGYTVPHPKTQQVTYLSNRAEAMEDTISLFKVSHELTTQLRVFSPDSPDIKETT